MRRRTAPAGAPPKRNVLPVGRANVARRSSSISSFSSDVSQPALPGRSGRIKKTSAPSSSAGAPSIINSHCQPLSPAKWSSRRICADTGEPITFEIGMAVTKTRHHRRPHRCRKPEGEIENHARIKSRLGNSQQEAQRANRCCGRGRRPCPSTPVPSRS